MRLDRPRRPSNSRGGGSEGRGGWPGRKTMPIIPLPSERVRPSSGGCSATGEGGIPTKGGTSKRKTGRSVGSPTSQRGQSLTEFAISSIVLLLLLGGLIDFARVFYFTSALHGVAFAGSRHAAWFDNQYRWNRYLNDADVTDAVNQGLVGAHLSSVSGVQGTCPDPTDGNAAHDPPYAGSLYPTGANAVYLYVCYTTPGGTVYGTMPSPPPASDVSWHLGDVNVILLFNYGLITGFMQNALQAFGGIHVATNAHFTIQGGP